MKYRVIHHALMPTYFTRLRPAILFAKVTGGEIQKKSMGDWVRY